MRWHHSVIQYRLVLEWLLEIEPTLGTHDTPIVRRMVLDA